MPMRWAAYAGVSTTLAVGVVLKALHQRSNFYSASVYLAQSNANLMILTNFIFLVVCALLLALQKVLYGPLRPIEIEQLYEKAWFAVTETCLAMTIFPRGELGGWFLVMFFSLLAGKVWGWIGEGRVEFLEQQPPSNPRLFHTRLAISLSMSILFNSSLLEYSIKTVLHQARPDMMVMFGFEFAILTVTSTSTALRYAISLAEIYIVRKQKQEILEDRRQELRRQREAAIASDTEAEIPTEDVEEIDELELDVPGWEEKGRWVFYLDLITDFLKLNLYLAFFAILLRFYGLPIHIIRDVFFTCRSFINRIRDFLRYRAATRDMNDRYPDATAEEVASAEVCIICREDMAAWPPEENPQGAEGETEARRRMRNNVAERMRPKKLPCGHVLHFSCLRSWLERQQNCPTCRRPVLDTRRLAGPGVGGARGEARPQDGHPPGPDQNADVNGNNAAQNQARVINFGPLRIGFGAGRGNLFNDLAQGVHDGEMRQPANEDANNAGAQQYGFGLGWNRNQRQEDRPQTNPSTNIQDQIRALEQQLQQEINGLRIAADQLQVIRMMQGELARLRIAHGTGATNMANGAPPRPFFPFGNMAQPFPSAPQTLTSTSQSTMISSGSSQLPEGLVLPEGWSMLPLHRLDQGPTFQGGTAHVPHIPQSVFTHPPPHGQGENIAVPPPPSHDAPVEPASSIPSQVASSTATTNTPSQSASIPPEPSRETESSASTVPEIPISNGAAEHSPEPSHSHANGISQAEKPKAEERVNTPSIPSWGFGDVRPSTSPPAPKSELPRSEPSNNDTTTPPESSSTAVNGEQDLKGKGKAATVEDFADETD